MKITAKQFKQLAKIVGTKRYSNSEYNYFIVYSKVKDKWATFNVNDGWQATERYYFNHSDAITMVSLLETLEAEL